VRVPWPDGVAVRLGEPLARHTARRTGGPCDAFVVVHARDALRDALAAIREAGWEWTLLGAGTRTVVRDAGVSGAVVRLGSGFAAMSRDGVRWDVGAAVPVGALVAATVAAGQGGVEDLAGVPGSFGASLALDPGPGRGWAERVERVTFLHRGRVEEGSLEDALRPKHPVVLGARLLLELGGADALNKRVRERLAASRAWSWYAAPGRADVRKVLRKAGVAGVRLRQVAMPESAPEDVVNLGGGTSADLALLERSVKDRVARERGVDLEVAVRFAGRVGGA